MEAKDQWERLVHLVGSVFTIGLAFYLGGLAYNNIGLLAENTGILPRIAVEGLASILCIIAIVRYKYMFNADTKKIRLTSYALYAGLYSLLIPLASFLEHAPVDPVTKILSISVILANGIFLVLAIVYMKHYHVKTARTINKILLVAPFIFLNILKVLGFASCCDHIIEYSVIALQAIFLITLLSHKKA